MSTQIISNTTGSCIATEVAEYSYITLTVATKAVAAVKEAIKAAKSSNSVLRREEHDLPMLSGLVGIVVNLDTNVAIHRASIDNSAKLLAMTSGLIEIAADYKDLDIPVPAYIQGLVEAVRKALGKIKPSMIASHARGKMAEMATRTSGIDSLKGELVYKHSLKAMEVANSMILRHREEVFAIACNRLGLDLILPLTSGKVADSLREELVRKFTAKYGSNHPGKSTYLVLAEEFSVANASLSAYRDIEGSSSAAWWKSLEKPVAMYGTLDCVDREALTEYMVVGTLCDKTLSASLASLGLSAQGYGLAKASAKAISCMATGNMSKGLELASQFRSGGWDKSGYYTSLVCSFLETGEIIVPMHGKLAKVDAVRNYYTALDPVGYALSKVPASWVDDSGEWFHHENLRIDGYSVKDYMLFTACDTFGGSLPTDANRNRLVSPRETVQLNGSKAILTGKSVNATASVGDTVTASWGKSSIELEVLQDGIKLPKRLKALGGSYLHKGSVKGLEWKEIELPKTDSFEALVIVHSDDVHMKPGTYVGTKGFVDGIGMLKCVLRVYEDERAVKGTALYTRGSFKNELKVIKGSSVILSLYRFEMSEDKSNPSDLWNVELMKEANASHDTFLCSISIEDEDAVIKRKLGTVFNPQGLTGLHKEIVGADASINSYNWKIKGSVKLYGRPAVSEVGETLLDGEMRLLPESGEFIVSPATWDVIAERCGGCDVDDCFRVTGNNGLKIGEEVSVLRNPKSAADGVYGLIISAIE